MRRALLGLGLLALLAACRPAVKAQARSPLPKGTAAAPAPNPPVVLTPAPPATRPPAATAPPLGHFRLLWPDPFTYLAPTAIPTPIPPPALPLSLPPGTVNILLLGSDRRGNEAFRTDVLLLVSIQPSAHGAALVSIPRDLYVYIPGFTMQRINAAYIWGKQHGYPTGGPGLLADTIFYNLGVPVHHYALVDMNGFRNIVDHLGGVDVRVACPYTDWRLKSPDLDPEEEDNWALYTVPAGVVHMDGDLALWYARSRKRSSDFDRARRQQEVLRALYRQMLRLNVLGRIPDLYDELQRTVETDLGLGDLLQLAALAGRIDPARIRHRFIGRDQVTSWRTPTGGQVLLPKPAEVRAVLEDAFNFEEVDPLLPEATVSVEVINASSQPGWDELAAERLAYAGFAAHVGAPTGGGGPTHLIDYGLTGPEVREQLRALLGLSPAAVVLQPSNPSPFHFRLVVGDDYRPCFDPTRP